MLRIKFAVLVAIAAAAPPPVVNIPGLGSVLGSITLPGNDTAPSVARFAGIPYAKPPVGELRWAPPVEHEAYTKQLDGTNLGSKCYQPAPGDGQSEDCLFLNVYAPVDALSSGKKLPVMFWIHGGAYTSGASNDYDGDGLVAGSAGGVVVVTTNYRLNVFGFLGSKELASTTSDKSTGNFGIQDQRLAMKWVQEHIGAFGGDSEDVMIFGESAGGNSVINHLAQKESFPFYTKAIIESGAYSTGATSLDSAEGKYTDLLSKAKCKSTGGVECLKKVSGADMQKLGSGGGWGPTVDGVNLNDAPTNLIEKGDYNTKVPIIIGSNRDEQAFFAILLGVPANMTELEFDVLMVGKDLKKIKELYKPAPPHGSGEYAFPKDLGNYSIWWWTYVREGTDGVPGLGPCAVRWLSRSLAQYSPSVHAYLFNHPTQAGGAPIPGVGPGAVTVPHASEIQYAFGAVTELTPGEEANLAIPFSTYWWTFAVTGDPNPAKMPAGMVQWPKYDPRTSAGDTVLVLDVPSQTEYGGSGVHLTHELRKPVCDYMEQQHHEAKKRTQQ